MLFLAAGDKVQVVTGSGVSTINMYAAWADADSSTPRVITVNRNAVAVTTSTTTDLVTAPAANHSANVKRLNISNDSASSCVITVNFYDGSTTFTLESITLGAGERLGYEEGTGFRYFDSTGKEKVASVSLGATANQNTADLSPAGGTDTYLAGSSLTIGNRIQVGSKFHWRVVASKTAAGIATPIFSIRFGTAGAIGDTARNTLTVAAQTAAIDVGTFDIYGAFTTVGASAVFIANLVLHHAVAVTGLTSGGTDRVYSLARVTSSAFDATPAGTIVGMSLNTGSSAVWTIPVCTVEADNLLN